PTLSRSPPPAVLLEKATGLALVVREREQEQLGGDELVAALLCLLVGEVEERVQLARDLNLTAMALDLGQSRDRLTHGVAKARNVDAGARKQRGAAPVVLREQRREHVQRLDELLVVADGDALGVGEGPLELGGELVQAHRRASGGFAPVFKA